MTSKINFAKQVPSLDTWLQEAKNNHSSKDCGMYLFHNGVVRQTSKAQARQGIKETKPIQGMLFDYDAEKVAQAIEAAQQMPGIKHIRVWLNQGELTVGDDIMLVLVGGDIRPNVIKALETLVSNLKNNCVTEIERS